MTAYDVMQISPIVPVIALEHLDDALPLAEALLEGGISIMEITLRTEAGLNAIGKISKSLPQMNVGAGTIINIDCFKRAVNEGAEFVFSPGINAELIQSSFDLDTPLIPGVATASEVMLALNNGIEHCKLFPAISAGGVEALKSFSGPFASMHFCPTGGINIENMNDFLSLDNVLCVGGSWIVPKQAIREKNFAHITELCKVALGAIH